MLRKLLIHNYALIDRLELQWQQGLNIITGETGAGKSILLGAMGLLLGQRADRSLLSDPGLKCIVEAEFDDSADLPENFFDEHDLDDVRPLTLRREISPEDKSRAFINDTPVPLAVLKEAGNALLDIHSQHQTLLLNNPGFRLSVVDAFAGQEQEVSAFRKSFREYRKKRKQWMTLQEAEQKAAADADYLRFQLEELEQAALEEGEQERWEDELRTLTHAEEIRSGLDHALQLAGEGDDNLLSRLSELRQVLGALRNYHGDIASLYDRVASQLIELKDIAAELDRAGALAEANPERMDWLRDRLDLVYRLQQKHRAGTVGELLRVQDTVAAQLSAAGSLSDDVSRLGRECSEAEKALLETAQRIGAGRRAAVPVIEKEMSRLMKGVAMPHAVFRVHIDTLPEQELSETGLDRAAFHFSANKGVEPLEISRVASGGELGRLMLCLKSILARMSGFPTIVFDEIDTGISGESAMKVGAILHEMGRHHQMIAITHLPQIAGKGDAHFFVHKALAGKKTQTSVRLLTGEERIVEIAKMLSGEKPTAGALENARELLQSS